jgi:SSS family transporter
MTVHLRPLDLAIVAAYLVGITLFGLRFREKRGADRSLRSYFLASNTIPWWAIALSIVSAETSTLTIISIPGVAFAGDFGFLQVVIGYMLGRIVVAAIFLPRYFAGNMLTAYQLIDQRFGPLLHKVTAGLFLLTRAAAEGVRVFAVSIVVGIAIGTRDVFSIAIISALTLLYTFEGGMAAVIWTDVVQMAIYVGGTAVAILTLGSHVSGGWSEIHTVAAAAGKFHMLDFAFNLTTTYTFWAGVLGGTFLTMASHGTDQLMVQRLLAARNLRESRLALLSSGVVIFIQFALFLLIGVGLYVFYGQHPTTFASSDRIFPTFIVHEMPLGIAGLLVAAILAAAMSNLSAALNSLSSTTVVDFYIRLRPGANDRERDLISKSSTVLWSLVLFAIAVYSLSVGGKGHVVEIGLSIASVAYGCLLGVFLLGTLTKFATQTGATIGMMCGFALNLWLWQGTFPVHLGALTIPHVAWTWYVLIGAFATFGIGSVASLIFRKQSKRMVNITVSFLLFFLLSFPKGICVSASAQVKATAPDFTPVSTLINDAISAHKLPGAVVVIGHDDKVVLENAYGVRKLAGEPGLDGKPSPAEPMTEDTIFDMASLSKCLATATAIMQLYEQGKIASFDDPVEKYLPAFNPEHDPARTHVTLRMLLTHTSGEGPDVSLKDPWGLASPDKAEGIHLALTTPLMSAPGVTFRYSDINFILLGDLIQTLSGQPEDEYAAEHIFAPLGMFHTRYLPFAKACGEVQPLGAAIVWSSLPEGTTCGPATWSGKVIADTAPTTHDNEGTAATNPDYDHLLRGTVNDPTTRRMGGVAGHAGVFSTAHDVSLFAQALLDKLLHNTGPFPLKQSTLQLMTSPEQPGHSPADVTGLPSGQYPSRSNHHVRGFGWDIDSDFSRPRGTIFPIGSFGHTGFTGTSLWMDPISDTYVILLANAIHAHGNPPISHLRGDVATAAAIALGITTELSSRPEQSEAERPAGVTARLSTLTGIDVLESTHFAALKGFHRIGLFTNQSGLDEHGARTIDILHQAVPLTTLFTPEHGITASLDTENIASSIDAATKLPILSLYGAKTSDRRPTHEQLKNLDAVVIDLQDAGVRFWTYEAATAYFLEAAALEQVDFHHKLEIILLDRPNPIGGVAVQGPVSDPGLESYVNTLPLPVRHGLTLGELARYIVIKEHLFVSITVVPMQRWSRTQYFSDTGLPWTPPSPNLRTPEAAILYPALGLIETTNVSVGRGTDHPFSFFGAGWMNASDVVAALNARKIPGVSFIATTEVIAEDKNQYPFHGATISALHLTVTDPDALNTPELGIEILSVLHRLYPVAFKLERVQRLLCSKATLDALTHGDDPRSIANSWDVSIEAFKTARAKSLLYP